MNNFNWNEFKNENVAVWCKTEELAKDFIEECYDRKITWKYGNVNNTYYEEYNNKMCYGCFDNLIVYCYLKFYRQENYKIIKWELG